MTTIDEHFGDLDVAKDLLRRLKFPEVLDDWTFDEFKLAAEVVARLGRQSVSEVYAWADGCFEQHGVYIDPGAILSEAREKRGLDG